MRCAPLSWAIWLAAAGLCAAPGAQAQQLKPSTQLSLTRLGQSPSVSAQPVRPVSASTEQADYIVAVVNAEPITRNQVRDRVQQLQAQVQQQGRALPPSSEITAMALERLINESAQVQEAKDTGIKVDDQALNQAEQNVARRNQMTVSQFHQALRLQGSTPERFRSELRQQLLVQRLREREVEGRVRVSDQDIDKYIAEQKAASASGDNAMINLAQILIPVPENASPEQTQALEQRANQALARTRAGEDFGKLVQEYSAGTGAPAGGAMGLRPLDRYPDLFTEATRNLPVGSTSGVLRSGAGFHILKVLDKDTSGNLPGSSVTQTQVRHVLLRTNPKLSEAEAIKQLSGWRERITSGKDDFAAIAREHSQDGSAPDGGSLGWVNPGVFVPEFEEVMNSLSLNEVSPPVVSRFGVHLIQVQGRREAKLSQTEQREMLRNIVREKKLEEAFTNWEKELRGRAYVELREPPAL